MSCEHTGHCHHHESDQQVVQLAQRLGDLCCRGQCTHIEHQLPAMDEARLHELEQRKLTDKSTETKPSKAKKKQLRAGFLQSLLQTRAAA